ncbi:hypothetical protein CQY20_33145 [Mycolicibacterium agri]|uniref:Enoyl-CoA hydratase/isomerase family protein n=1 Tax=Mycolicibacterium agri TaxID=36811 RepID=A0A2A7MNT4_MYCAG|nr:hypothetical protein [Mycolicibacterium agri]PEG33001.1 hypothetical protein CQY20_33145 [Mycolicibacterium agri]
MARVTINNPPINLVTPEFLVDLPDLIDQMQASTDVHGLTFGSTTVIETGAESHRVDHGNRRAAS